MATMRQVVEQAGFRVRKVSHSNLAILVPAALLRAVKGLRHKAVQRAYTRGFTHEPSTPETDFMPVPGWVNSVLTAYYQVESRALRRITLPVGLSVVCVAQKPGRRKEEVRDKK
jgi:hypothetical protein